MRIAIVLLVMLSSVTTTQAGYIVSEPARAEALAAPKAASALFDLGTTYSSGSAPEMKLQTPTETVIADYTGFVASQPASISITNDGGGAVRMAIGSTFTNVVRPSVSGNTLVVVLTSSAPQTSVTLSSLTINGEAQPTLTTSGPAGRVTREFYGVPSFASMTLTANLTYTLNGPIFKPAPGDTTVEFYFTTTSAPVPEPASAGFVVAAACALLARRRKR
ncbi:MAG: hypothetical protein V4519_03095 [Patescibacteria group bacterium]